MNCFCHALPHLDSPWRSAGACLPDWLGVIDRRVRIRSHHAREWTGTGREELRELAEGVIQHHADDQWFHGTAAFQTMNIALSLELRGRWGIRNSMLTHLAAHILIEMLIDDWLARIFPGSLERYYLQLQQLPAGQLEALTVEMAGKPIAGMAAGFERFVSSRFLFDYAEDAGVLYRLNRVLERVRLPGLPGDLLQWLPEVRGRVRKELPELLAGYPPWHLEKIGEHHEVRDEPVVVDGGDERGTDAGVGDDPPGRL